MMLLSKRQPGTLLLLYFGIIEVASTTSRQRESGTRQDNGELKQLQNSCSILETLEGEMVECYRSEKPRGSVNCAAETSPANTVAEIRCGKFWSPKQSGPSSTKRVCVNSEWIRENSNFTCELDCGLANFETEVERRTAILKGSSPWVAGIFYTEDPRASQQSFSHICEGTLISNRAILTSAQCVTFHNTTVDRRPEDLKVALGNFRREFYKNTGLYHDVEKIIVHYEYNTMENDLALIWLAEPIKIDAFHHPLCLPDEIEELGTGSEGKVTVLAGDALAEREIKVINSPACRQHSSTLAQQRKSSKFCVQSRNDISVCNSFGTGAAFPHPAINRKWTLQGIRTGRQRSPDPDCRAPIPFTNIARFRQWIDKELSREPPIYSAGGVISVPTPTTPESTFSTSSTTARRRIESSTRTTTESGFYTHNYKEREPLTPEPFLVPHFTSSKAPEVETFPRSTTSRPGRLPKPTVRTERPLETELSHNGKINQISGRRTTTTKPPNSFVYPVLPTRFPISTPRTNQAETYPQRETTSRSRTTPQETITSTTEKDFNYQNPLIPTSGTSHCPPLHPIQGVSQLCKHDDYEDIDDCSSGGQVGTVATLKCENYYKSAFGSSSLRKECMPNRKWSAPRAFGCKLECGISSSPRRSYIVNGVLSDRVSWPWHATIFKLIDGDFQYICGGTLISKSLLLTAAHCLTKPMSTDTVDKEDFRIVLAAKSSNYTENLFDRVSQANVFYVKKISIPDTYNGVTFESDIALIQLEFKVQLSDYVKPVCFPFQSKENSDIVQLHLSPDTKGFTVGFGYDETGHLSKTMRETSLPVVSHRECGEVLARFPSHSMFCAGYLNGTSAVCNGDSGSGLFFSDGTGFSNRFIVQGIVSYGDHVLGSRLCNHDSYAVFTKVSSFAPWVQYELDHLDPEFR